MRRRWRDLSFKFKIVALIIIMLGFVAATAAGYHRLLGDVRDMCIERTTDMMLQGYKNVQEKKRMILETVHTLTTGFLRKLHLVLAAALIIVVGPLFLLLVRGIVKPILELTEAADEYSLGNLDLVIPATERKDEIG